MSTRFVSMEEPSLSLQDVLAMVRRRALHIGLVAAGLATAALPAAMLWPAVYRSTATILIEEQEIPRDLVRSTVTSLADERIQVISQQVMTRSTLMQIVQKYELYPRERRYLSNEEILDRMRRDIRVQTISAEEARPGARAIAFKLSYDNETPDKAQKVANELVSLYLNENVRTRRQRADEATVFLADEAKRIGKQISEIESRLAAFKRTYAGRLPELMPLNMQLRDRAEAELDELERQIRMLDDRRVYLETQLTVVKENAPVATDRVLEPEERLKSLRNQFTSLSGIYAPSHPDILRMRREIEALEKKIGGPPESDPKVIDEARNELKQLADRYSPDHPDVVRQRKRLEALETEQAKLGDGREKKPDNPAYVTIAAQIESTRREAQSLQPKRAELRARIETYQKRLEETPGIEQAYRDLLRDYDNAYTKYKEIRAKQMEAQVALELEKDRKGERFSLIDPPQYPEKPFQPDRRKLLGLALAGSLAGGLGVAGAAEVLDRSVKSARALGSLVQAPLLGVVPRAENDAQRARRRRRWAIALLGFLLLGLLGLAAIHVFFMPLDSLWYVMLRRLQF